MTSLKKFEKKENRKFTGCSIIALKIYVKQLLHHSYNKQIKILGKPFFLIIKNTQKTDNYQNLINFGFKCIYKKVTTFL